MTIEKRLERLEAIVDARGLDWDHPRVVEEPAKEAEPEHPAGPKPDPREGYRILAKDPPEDLQPGDEYELAPNAWFTSNNARTHRKQEEEIWYRRKVEPPKPPEPEYREPVLPGDAGKECEFSDDCNEWTEGRLRGYAGCFWQSVCVGESVEVKFWTHARINKDA